MKGENKAGLEGGGRAHENKKKSLVFKKKDLGAGEKYPKSGKIDVRAGDKDPAAWEEDTKAAKENTDKIDENHNWWKIRNNWAEYRGTVIKQATSIVSSVERESSIGSEEDERKDGIEEINNTVEKEETDGKT